MTIDHTAGKAGKPPATAAARRSFCVALAGALVAGKVHAQSKGGLRLLVGFPAGGSSDALARLLAGALRGGFEAPVIVENKAGAGGRIAIESLKTTPADGSLVLIAPNPVVTMYPHVYKRLSYDPVADVVPLARLATYPLFVSIGPAVPSSVTTLRDFVQWVKAQPNGATYGSPASGTTPHFVGMMLAKEMGIELTHVPYRGDAPAIQDLLGGQVAMSINVPAAQLPHVGGGKLRVLATTGSKRAPSLPEVPTLRESGSRIVTSDWFGAFLPRGTSAETTARLQTALRDALQVREVVDALARLGIDTAYLPGQETAKLIREESQHWAAVVKATGFTPED